MSKNIKGITIEIGGNTQPLNNALEGVNKKSRDLQGELRQVDRLLKLDPKNTDLIAQKQKILAESVENTKNKLETLKEAEKQAQQQFKEGKIGEEQYRALQREVIATEQNLKNLEKQLKETNNGWKDVADGLDKFGTKSTEVGKDMTKKVTLPIVGIGVAAAKIGMDFEQSMSKVQAMSGATSEEMERLEKSARDAGATTSKSAKDAADALSYMALAGWDVDTSISGLMPVLRLAEAGNIDLARASSLVTDSMSAMGIQVQDLPRYLDVVAQTARSSNTDIDQMAEAYLGVGGTLRGLGVPLEESAISLGMLANAGIKGSEAGTKLNKILLNLTAPTGQAKKALDELNLSAFDSEGKFKGLDNVLFEVKNKTKDMTTEQRNMYLSMIAGSAHVDGMNALINGLDDSYAELKESIGEADGALNEIAETMMDNNKGSITNLLSALEELALKIYDIIAPAIADLIAKLQGVVDWLNNLSPGVQQAIVVIAGLVAAIGPVLIVVGKMATGLSAIIKLFGGFSAASGAASAAATGATTATGGLSAVIAAITGPIGIAIAAIAAIGAVIVGLWKTNEEFRENIKAIWEQIKEIFTLAFEAVKGIIMGFYEGLKLWWEEHSEKILKVINILWEAIGFIVNVALNIIRSLFEVFISLFTGDWEGLGERIKDIWSGMWNAIKGVVQGAWNLLESAFKSLYDNIAGWFSDLVSDAVSWGKNMIQGFIDGIKSMISKVKSAVSSVTSAVSGFLGFNSPAKEGEGRHIVKWGYNMIDGFIEGMQRAMPELQTSAKAIIPNLDKEIREVNNPQSIAIDYGKMPKGDTIIHVHNPQPSPSELARQIKKTQRDLALGF